jgi:hypothetical protein
MNCALDAVEIERLGEREEALRRRVTRVVLAAAKEIALDGEDGAERAVTRR